ncbi:MAG: AmmeMemoRadiSam system radical SAM enzyme [Candidatus Acetothermia bacterium]
MKEAMFYEGIGRDRVRCNLCPWNCEIDEGERGICGVRENRNGTLYSLSYDNLTSANLDPIEKKPLFNFAPGTETYSICTAGCNWKCKYCQNWQLSQGDLTGRSTSPEEIVTKAKDAGAKGISYTYTEPTIFYELAYETARIAHENGLYNTFVTNGYINPEPVRRIAPFLDAVTVDFKGSGDEDFLKKFAGVADLAPVYTSIMEYYRNGVHVEITDLIVPEIGDSKESTETMVDWIANNPGADTPLHFLRFYPAYRVKDLPPTPIETLTEAKQIAESRGMDYVYLGNVGRDNSTRCPNCGHEIITRRGPRALRVDIANGLCPNCGKSINVSGLDWTGG